MIEIKNSNIQQISRKYTDSVIIMKRNIKRNNKYLAYLFYKRKFEDIVSCPPSSLIIEIERFNKQFPDINYEAKDWCDFKKYMIGQYEKVRKEILYDVLDSLNLSVCPYCNRQYILVLITTVKLLLSLTTFIVKVNTRI